MACKQLSSSAASAEAVPDYASQNPSGRGLLFGRDSFYLNPPRRPQDARKSLPPESASAHPALLPKHSGSRSSGLLAGRRRFGCVSVFSSSFIYFYCAAPGPVGGEWVSVRSRVGAQACLGVRVCVAAPLPLQPPPPPPSSPAAAGPARP